MLTKERVNELLEYDPETGIFLWKVNRRGTAKKGTEAGVINRTRVARYRKIGIDHQIYYAHRLAYLVMLGRWPEDQVDHINGNGTDNRWCNLREVDSQGNSLNMCLSGRNTSGQVGVHYESGKWVGSIRLDGCKIHLGRFSNYDDAVKARKGAEKEYGYHANHGRKKITTTRVG